MKTESALAVPATFGTGQSRTRAADEKGPASGVSDCQSHLYRPELVQMMEKRTADPVVYRKDEERRTLTGNANRLSGF